MSDNTNLKEVNPAPGKLNLIETIAGQDRFSTLSRVLGSSGANALFSSGNDFTVLAPTNDAFAKIPDTTMNNLLNETGQAKLKALLSFHILPGKVMAADVAGRKTALTLTGEAVTITDTDGIKINGAKMQTRNIEATNGVVHAIDTVLAPNAKAPVSN